MTHPKQEAAETVQAMIDHARSGDFDAARALFSGEVETLPLPTAGENETQTFTLGEAREEGETLAVPVTVSFCSPEARGEETVEFVCVKTEAGMRIDMDRTLRNIFGAAPEDLLAAMKEAVEDGGEAAEPPEEVWEEDPYDRSDFDRDRLSDEFREGMSRIEEAFGKKLNAIGRRLQNEKLIWEIGWGTMPSDENGAERLLNAVLTPLEDALFLLDNCRHEAPGEPGGTGMEKVRAGIQKIRIVNVNNASYCGCSLENGRLTLKPCLQFGWKPLEAEKALEKDEIEWAIRDGLDLDVGPTIRGAEADVTHFVDRCREHIGFEPAVSVDWDSFRAIGSGKTALPALEAFRKDLLSSLHYNLHHLNGKIPMTECLESVRFKSVGSSEESGVHLEGKRLVFLLFKTDQGKYYDADELERILSKLPWELPSPPAAPPEAGEAPSAEEGEGAADEAEEIAEESPSGPEEEPAPGPETGPAPSGVSEAETHEARVSAFRQTVESMERDMLPGMRRQLSELFGREVGLEVDWESLEADPDRFDLVVTGVMGMVLASLMNLAFYPESKGSVVAAVNAVRMLYDGQVQGVALRLEGGVLTAACGGPAAAYTQDFELMLGAVRQLVRACEEGSKARG